MSERKVAAARGVIIAVISGAAVGAFVGGLGGRLAMRLTAAWTDGPPFTLTGAEVGVLTLGGTLSVMGSAAQGGAIVGLLYAVVRWALPFRHRPSVFALLARFWCPGDSFLETRSSSCSTHHS